jgi:ABC-type nitrate/sulfonate/bicarbonate transport system substrate-binding protein
MSPFTRSTRRALAATVAVTALAASLVACSGASTSSSSSGSGTSEEPIPASLQLGWLPNIESGMFVYADEKGYYEDEGVDVTILPGGPDVAIDAQVTSGKALVGLFSTESLANAVLNGAPLVAVSATYQYSSNGIVTLADSGITEPQQLEGHVIGLSANDRTTVPFLTWLGLDMDTITVVPTDGTATPLVSGEVDAVVSPKGNVPVVLQTQGIETNFAPVAEYGYNRWSGVLAVRKDSLEDPEKLAAIKGIIAGTQQGTQALLDDPEAVGEVVFDVYGEQQGLTEESQLTGATIWAELVQQGQDLYGGKLTEITEEGIATAQDLLTNILKVDIDASTLFDLSVAKDVLK